jgi:site-specific DNA-adenine methylase
VDPRTGSRTHLFRRRHRRRCGSLVNKDPDSSTVEVYNDRDEDLVHFVEVLRDRTDDLLEWLDDVPFSREMYSRWTRAFDNGYRPNDDVERAGQFFFLRHSQWGGKDATKSGFATSKVRSRAQAYAIDILPRLKTRESHGLVEPILRRPSRPTSR